MSYRLLVENLGSRVSYEDLLGLFGAFGNVDAIAIRRVVSGDAPRVYAYVDMANADEAQACVKGIGGEIVEGRPLKIRLCLELVAPVEMPCARIGGRAAAIGSVFRRRAEAVLRVEEFFRPRVASSSSRKRSPACRIVATQEAHGWGAHDHE